MKIIKHIIFVCLFSLCGFNAYPQQPDSYDDYIESAKKSLEMGDYSMAKLLCADAMIEDISRPEAYIYSAIALYKEDDLLLAKEYIEKALLWSDETQKNYCLGILKSIDQKRQFNELKADATYLEKTKSMEQAASKYYLAWKLFPVRADVGIKAAELFIKTNEYPKAMEVLSELKKYPDPQVKNLASSLYESLDNSKIIKDKKAFEYYYAKAEQNMEAERYGDAISDYNRALSYKPNDYFIKSKIRTAEEEKAFQSAINSNYVEDSEKYADRYPNGKYITRINNLIRRSYLSIATKFYNEAKEANLRNIYNKYKQRFPGDQDIEKVKYQLSSLYFRSGETYFDRKEWSNAKGYYQKYLSLYYSGSDAVTAQRKVKVCTRRLNQRSSSFAVFSYEINSPLGISLGSLKRRKAGFYMNMKLNSEIFTGFDVLYTVDDAGNHDRPGDIVRLGEDQFANIAVSAGATFKIAYPLYGYIGAGVGYYPYYEKVDVYFSTSGDYWEEDWLRNTDQTAFKAFPEFGVYLKVANSVVLKYGVLYNEEIFHQLGFGFVIN